MDISFPAEEYLDATCDLIWFPVCIDGKRVRCVMEIETLQACCRADMGDPMPTFHANRPLIEAAVVRLIGENRFQRDGSVLVEPEDVQV